jgi:hypothetical protein
MSKTSLKSNCLSLNRPKYTKNAKFTCVQPVHGGDGYRRPLTVNMYSVKQAEDITFQPNSNKKPKEQKKQIKSAFLIYKGEYYISKQWQTVERGHLIVVTLE